MLGTMIQSLHNRPLPTLSKNVPAAARSVSVEAPADPSPGDSCCLQSSPVSAPSPALQSQGMTSALQAASAAAPGAASAVLKVLSLNTMFDCQNGVDVVADVIRNSGADLVGLQESVRNTRVLAKKLGMHWVQQDKRTALLSRFPIESVSSKRYAVTVSLDNGARVAFANAHLTSFPFQSHQLCHLPSGGGPYLNTEEEAIASADKTRGDEVRTMIRESDATGLPSIAVGDFNEPSYLDWTTRAAEAGRHPIKVDWPASRQFQQAGYKDSYREIYPDEMTHPGNTWTPDTKPDDPSDHHDRIDFVMYRGSELQLKSAQILGESAEFADVVMTPWPSDHRAVLATFEVAPPTAAPPSA